jgi:hypothetical protein
MVASVFENCQFFSNTYRFAERMPSRAATVRELFKLGLAAEGFLSAPAGTRSKDFGVDGKTARLPRNGANP